MKQIHKLSLLLLVLLLPSTATANNTTTYDFKVDGIYYNITSSTNKTVEVTYIGYDEDYIIYSNYCGSVTIPKTVTNNGTTYSVTSIGNHAFSRCRGLTSVIIPESVTSIGSWAFNECRGLTSVTIPNSVTSIGDGAFSGCSGLTNVTIGNSVTTIGDYAFYGCSGLTSVNISDIEAWCKISFSSSTSNPLSYGHHLYLNGEEVTDLVIPNTVTNINYTFSGCSGLTSVTIPNSVTSIGGGAFSGCSGLTSVTIPNSVTSIGGRAFYECSGLTSVTIPNSVTNIGNSTFNKCSSLTSVTIGNSVTTIGDYAFNKCSSLTSVTIGNSVTTIGDYAFYECSGLTSVTIPNSVTNIGNSAFYYCSGLTSVTCMAKTPPSMASSSCFSTYSKTTLYVPHGTLGAYKSASYWYKFYKIYEVDEDGNILVTSLTLNVTDQIMNVGETLSLSATVEPDAAFNRVVQWSSSDNSVAAVDSIGQVTAVGVGTAIITVITTDGSDLSATCSVTVVRRVTDIMLNASSLDLVLPETTQLVATVTPSNATNGTLRWTSSRSSVATVDDSGLVKSVAPGTATITATTTDGTNLSASCTVTVTRQYVTGITLSATNITLCKGNTYQLSADIAPGNASNKALNWSSNSTTVASVDNDGLVTAKAVGTATITAKAADGSGISASCKVTVLPDNYMAIDTLTHIRGEAAELVEVPLSLFNRDEISAIQFDVSLPSCASLGYPEVTLNDARATRSHTISINKLSTNNYRVLIASPQSKNLVGNDGPIAYLNLLLDKNVTTAGNYYLTVSNIIASGADETRYSLPSVQGLIRYYYIVGDVNADLSVDIADYMATASKILTRTPSPFYSDAADVDQNSSINVTDLVGITNIALGIKPITLRYAPRRDAESDRLTASKLTLTAEGQGEVTLDLDADFDFAAFQMDMALPKGLILTGIELGQEAHKLQPVWEALSDGTVRLLASSFSDADCAGNSPELLTIKLRTDGSYSGQGTLRIHDIAFADRHLISHVLDDVVVDCYGATGIGEMCVKVRIYVEDGKIIVETPEGGTVRVSDIFGHIREYPVTAGRNVLTPWAEGILIISFDNQTIKIKL